jgi:RNA polymerase sigma-70 factor, ECF subfamily
VILSNTYFEFTINPSRFSDSCVILSEKTMRVNTMIVAQAKPLDKQDLVEIYEDLSPALYRYAVRLLGSRDIAEDCVSETFSRFLQAVRNGAGPNENVRAYLYRVAHNWITDHYRRTREATQPLDNEGPVDTSTNPSRVVAEEHEHQRVRKALLRLPPDQQQVIALRFLDEMSHEETAVILGKTSEATRALQYRALTSLRHLLREEE